jgi:peroxiredoxin
MALIVTAAVVVVILAGALILFVRANGARASEAPAASSAVLPSTSSQGSAAPTAAAITDLEKAADAVGFTVTTGANVGVIENLPADTTLLAPSRTLLPVGSTAPDFTLSTPDGKLVTLSQYRGKTVFLEFFATWCPHCQAEAPHLLRLYNSLPASSVVFLSVNGDSEDAASIHAFTRHFGLPWAAFVDPGLPAGSFSQQGGIGSVSRSYGLGLFPTFYIIDPKGRIAWRSDREQPDTLLAAKLHDVSGS